MLQHQFYMHSSILIILYYHNTNYHETNHVSMIANGCRLYSPISVQDAKWWHPPLLTIQRPTNWQTVPSPIYPGGQGPHTLEPYK